MPVELKIKCSGEIHRLAISQPEGKGAVKVEMLDHPSLELLQGFSAFGAKKAECQQAVEDIGYSFEDFLKDPAMMEAFLEEMRTKKGRTEFFESPPKQANKALEKLLEGIVSVWIDTASDARHDETINLIREFVDDDQLDYEEDDELQSPDEWLKDLATDALIHAIEADDDDAVEPLVGLSDDITYTFGPQSEWPTDDEPGYKKIETQAELEIGPHMVASWSICLEGSYNDTSLDSWSVVDCGSDMPPSAASAFLDAMHESYSDPEEIVELDEPDVPTDEGEGEYSVWDGDELLAIFGDEYDADQFYEVAYFVAEYHGSGTGSLEVRHLTEEAMEQMDAEDGDVDFTDPANWE